MAAPDVVVPTLDTVRHEALLYTWLAEHKPLVLCGPPGSGKTMTLFSALRALPDMEVGATLTYLNMYIKRHKFERTTVWLQQQQHGLTVTTIALCITEIYISTLKREQGHTYKTGQI